MRDFRTLKVWQKSHQLTLAIYQLTKQFPSEERFGIISQMRQSSSSIATNIAEGCGRRGNKELRRFCLYSLGSLSELDYQLLLSKDLSYISTDQFKQYHQNVFELKKMLSSFISHLQKT